LPDFYVWRWTNTVEFFPLDQSDRAASALNENVCHALTIDCAGHVLSNIKTAIALLGEGFRGDLILALEPVNQTPVHTENSVRSENTGVPTIREIMVDTTMSSLFVAFFALIASTFRTRAALQAEILALRHQLAVLQKNAPRRLRLRPAVVGCVVPMLVRLATMSRDGSARHRPPLAPPSFRLALDQEIPPPSRKARSCGQHS
jgi:hypothetical protein